MSDSTDAWAPAEIARKVADVGVAKARADTTSLFVLAVLAGAYVALGAAFYLIVVSSSGPVTGPTLVLGGVAFSLGLVLVVVGGAELFNGNILVAMAYAACRIGKRDLLRSWLISYAGNVVGAVGTVALLGVANTDRLLSGEFGRTAIAIAHAKAQLSPPEALARGILCNALICAAVWLAMGGRSLVDKVIGVVFPITAFVALGFEHSIANWFFLPYAMLLEGPGATTLAAGAAWNLAFVTIGNVIGGTFLVAGVYWIAYLRPGKA